MQHVQYVLLCNKLGTNYEENFASTLSSASIYVEVLPMSSTLEEGPQNIISTPKICPWFPSYSFSFVFPSLAPKALLSSSYLPGLHRKLLTPTEYRSKLLT